MHKQTVLEIIKMINHRFNDADSRYTNLLLKDQTEESTKLQREYFSGKADAYDELLEHLQSYIEAQLNAEELKTGE